MEKKLLNRTNETPVTLGNDLQKLLVIVSELGQSLGDCIRKSTNKFWILQRQRIYTSWRREHKQEIRRRRSSDFNQCLVVNVR